MPPDHAHALDAITRLLDITHPPGETDCAALATPEARARVVAGGLGLWLQQRSPYRPADVDRACADTTSGRGMLALLQRAVAEEEALLRSAHLAD